MSFKSFYKEKETVNKELLEAYESFYLAESLEAGAKVKIKDFEKLASRFPGQPEFTKEDVYTFYNDLNSVPAAFRKDRELVVLFGDASGAIKKNESGDMLIPSGVRSNILELTPDEKVKDIFNSASPFTKEKVVSILKAYAKTKKEDFDAKEIKQFSKTIVDGLDEEDGVYDSPSISDFKKRSKQVRTNFNDSASYKRFNIDFFKFVEDKSKELKGGLKNVVAISEEELEYIIFGSEKNTKTFAKAYEMAADKVEITDASKFTSTMELNRFFLLTPDETLLDIIYNEKQESTTPEKMVSVVDVEKEEKSKKVKEYKKDHENAQVLGVFLPNAKDVLIKVLGFEGDEETPYESPKFQKIVAPLFKAISEANDKQDVKTYLKWLEENLKDASLQDFIDVLSYASGVAEFFKNVVNYKSPNVIFAQIKLFVAAESKKLQYKGEDDYGKVSTVDFVVTNVDGDELISLINKKNTKLVPNNGSIDVVDEEGNILANYYQVSLKTSKTTASLGRNMELVKKKFGNHISKANEIHESLDLLNEGVFSKLTELGKKGFEKLKEIGKSSLEKIRRLTQSLRSWAKNTIDQFIKLSDTNIMDIVEELYDVELFEATFRNMDIPKLAYKLNEKEDKLEIYKKAQAKLVEKLKTLQNGKQVGNVLISISVVEPTEVNVDKFINQIYHYNFLNTFSTLYTKGMDKKNVLEIINDIVDLYAESIFGATKLPLWKVYKGGAGDDISYELVGSKDKFKEDRKKKLGVVVDDVCLIKLFGKTSDKYWHMMCLVDLLNEKGEQVYSRFEIGPSKNGRASSAKFMGDDEKSDNTSDK